MAVRVCGGGCGGSGLRGSFWNCRNPSQRIAIFCPSHRSRERNEIVCLERWSHVRRSFCWNSFASQRRCIFPTSKSAIRLFTSGRPCARTKRNCPVFEHVPCIQRPVSEGFVKLFGTFNARATKSRLVCLALHARERNETVGFGDALVLLLEVY